MWHFLLFLILLLWPNATQIHAQESITIRQDEFVRLGTAIEHPSYDYGPTIMRDDDGVYKMWWCAHDVSQGGIIDGIFYADSTDGIHWNQRGRVLKTMRPPQGTFACDPSVVKANNNYYLYYTSEGGTAGAGTDNSIFLGWWDTSVYPNQTWSYVNNGSPVITATNFDRTYGIGQSSVLFLDNRFIQFYTNTIGGMKVIVAQSTNGGTIFTPLNNGNPVVTGVGAVDVKYFPTLKKYLMIAERNWNIQLLVLNDAYQVIKRATFAPGVLPNPCNHNPGLLGDRRGVALDTQHILVYFGSGSYRSGTDCWNPDSWDIPVYRLNLERLLTTDPSPTQTPILRGDLSDHQGNLKPDGRVDIYDLRMLIANFGRTGNLDVAKIDINSDGMVNIFDYNQLVGNFGKTQ